MADFTVSSFFLILDTLADHGTAVARRGIMDAERAGCSPRMTVEQSLKTDHLFVGGAERALTDAKALAQAFGEIVRVAQPLSPPLQDRADKRRVVMDEQIAYLTSLLDVKE